MRILIIKSSYHPTITEALTQGCLETLHRAGLRPGDINVLPAPGAFEIPVLAAKAAQSKKWDGLIALGCVIKGETPHFDYISASVAEGLQQISIANQVPVAFGILTTNTLQQALVRSGLASPGAEYYAKERVLNKGSEAAEALLQALSSLRMLESEF